MTAVLMTDVTSGQMGHSVNTIRRVEIKQELFSIFDESILPILATSDHCCSFDEDETFMAGLMVDKSFTK